MDSQIASNWKCYPLQKDCMASFVHTRYAAFPGWPSCTASAWVPAWQTIWVLVKPFRRSACCSMSANGCEATAPVLLVCPTSVVGNWMRELQRFAPSLRVMAHRGPDRRQGRAFDEAAAEHDIVLTSYPLFARDIGTLQSVTWGTAVLDEAQNIKNSGAKQSQAARAIPATQRIALTGTPVENRLSELWSIMAFLNPGYLGSEAAFRRELARPIERTGDVQARERLRRLTAPFVLRRLKTDPTIISDLPEKQEMKVYCSLTAEQATLYQAVVDQALAEIEEAEADGSAIQRRGQVLSMLMRLKQVCNHPAQFLKDGSAVEGRSGKLATAAGDAGRSVCHRRSRLDLHTVCRDGHDCCSAISSTPSTTMCCSCMAAHPPKSAMRWCDASRRVADRACSSSRSRQAAPVLT